MLVLCWFFTFKLFTTTATHHSVIISKPEFKDRKVNLALETVLEFNNKDNTADLNFLDNVQQFIGKVKTVIDKKIVVRSDVNDDGVLKFTDFIHNAIEILNKYHDGDLEDFFYVLSDEVRKYHYRGCKFHELTDNYSLRRRIASELDVFKNITAESLRQKISAIAGKIKKKSFSKNEKELVNLINSLYRQDSVEKFKKILASIDDYRLKNKDHMSLVKIVREGLRSIIFDHYTELNHNARVALKFIIDDHWKYLMDLSKASTLQQYIQEIKLRNYVDDRIEIDGKKHNGKHKTKPKTAKRTTNNSKRAKTDIYINLNKHLHVKYETPLHKHTTKSKKKAPKLTFMTLYPKFVSDYRLNFRGANTPTTATTRNTITFWRERDRDVGRIVNRLRIYDTDTEVTLKLRQRRPSTIKGQKGTKMTQPIYLSKEVEHLQYKSSTYDKIDILKRVPKSTIRTLYSKTTVDTTMIIPRVVKNKFVSLENTMHALNKNKESHKRTTSESGVTRAASPIKHQVFLDFVTMMPYVPRKLNQNQKLKYEINIKAQENTRKSPELSLKKPVIENDNPKAKFLNSNTMEAQRSFVENNPEFNEELSAKEKIDENNRRSYRKSFTNIPKDKILVDRRILTRLQDLEKELRVVKTQIKNDTEIIKDLNSKVYGKVKSPDEYKHMNQYDNTQSNKDRKTEVTKEVVIDVAAHMNLDDYRLQKGGRATRDKSTIFKLNNNVRNTHQYDANKNKKVIDRKYDFDKSTFNRDKSKNDNEHLLSKDKYRNRSALQTNIKHSHELNNYQRNPYNAESYNNKKLKEKDYDRSTINRLDDYGDDNQFQRDSEILREPPKKAIKQRSQLKGLKQDSANPYSNNIDERKYDIDRNTFKAYKINEEDKEKNNDVHTYTYKNKNYMAASKYRKEQERKYYAKEKKYSMYDSDRDKRPRERLYDSDSNNKNYNTGKINYSDINNQKLVEERTHNINHDNGQNNFTKLGNHGLYTNKTNVKKAQTYTKDVAKDIQKHFDSQNEPLEDKHNVIFYKADNKRNELPDLSDDKQHMHSRIRSNASIDDKQNEIHSERSHLKIKDVLRSNPTKHEYDNSDLLNEHNMDTDHKQNPEKETTKHKEMHEKVSQDIEVNHGFTKDTLYTDKDEIYKSNKEDQIGHDFNKEREEKHNDQDNKLNHQQLANKYDLDHAKNDPVFKVDTKKDMLPKYMTHDYIKPNNKNDSHKTELKKDFDGYSLNDHLNTNQLEQNITGDVTNKSINSDIFSNDTNKHLNDTLEHENTNEKEKNDTIIPNTNKKKLRKSLNNHLETMEEKLAAKNKAIDLRISKENENYTDTENDWHNTTSTVKTSKVNLTTVTTETRTESLAPKRTFIETTPDPTTTVSTSLTTSLTPFKNKTNENHDKPVPEFDEMGLFNLNQGYNETGRAGEPPSLPKLSQFEDIDKLRFNNTEDFETIMNKTLELYSRRKNKNESELFGDDLDKTGALLMPNYLEMPDIDQMIL